jgi:2-C-methyl-D-erythritol 4-phosphate cytidylyltransferase
MSEKKIISVILASGTGNRISNKIPKQFLRVSGLPLIIHALKPFESHPKINEIIIVTLSSHINKTRKLVEKHNFTKVSKIVPGGKSRQESSRIGVNTCGEDTEFVLIHDAARPFTTTNLLSQIINKVKKHKAVVPVIPSTDTIVEIDAKGTIKNIPNRLKIKRVQTPQAFKYELIKEAHKIALEDGSTDFTDDSSLILRMGHPVFTLRGNENNIKITLPIDMYIASKILREQ